MNTLKEDLYKLAGHIWSHGRMDNEKELKNDVIDLESLFKQKMLEIIGEDENKMPNDVSNQVWPYMRQQQLDNNVLRAQLRQEVEKL